MGTVVQEVAILFSVQVFSGLATNLARQILFLLLF